MLKIVVPGADRGKTIFLSRVPRFVTNVLHELIGNLGTTTTTLSTTTGSELQVYSTRTTSKFRRRGVADDAKQSRITSSCNPQASAGINLLF